MHRPFTSGLLIVAAGITLGGCGSGSATTSSSSPAQSASAAASTGADSICKAANAKINAIQPPADMMTPADASSLPAIASYLDSILPLAQQEQADLSAAPDAGPINAPFADVITKLQAADTAAKGTDVAAYTSAAKDFNTVNDAFHAAAKSANLPNCSQ